MRVLVVGANGALGFDRDDLLGAVPINRENLSHSQRFSGLGFIERLSAGLPAHGGVGADRDVEIGRRL
jgi:hypothetical protein